MTRRGRIQESISALAALFEHGVLQADTDPAAFLDRVRARIAELEAQVEKLEQFIARGSPARVAELEDSLQREQCRNVELEAQNAEMKKLLAMWLATAPPEVVAEARDVLAKGER